MNRIQFTLFLLAIVVTGTLTVTAQAPQKSG